MIDDHSISAPGVSEGMLVYVDKPDWIEPRMVFSMVFRWFFTTWIMPCIDLFDATRGGTHGDSFQRRDYVAVGVSAIEAGPTP